MFKKYKFRFKHYETNHPPQKGAQGSVMVFFPESSPESHNSPNRQKENAARLQPQETNSFLTSIFNTCHWGQIYCPFFLPKPGGSLISTITTVSKIMQSCVVTCGGLKSPYPFESSRKTPRGAHPASFLIVGDNRCCCTASFTALRIPECPRASICASVSSKFKVNPQQLRFLSFLRHVDAVLVFTNLPLMKGHFRP